MLPAGDVLCGGAARHHSNTSHTSCKQQSAASCTVALYTCASCYCWFTAVPGYSANGCPSLTSCITAGTVTGALTFCLQAKAATQSSSCSVCSVHPGGIMCTCSRCASLRCNIRRRCIACSVVLDTPYHLLTAALHCTDCLCFAWCSGTRHRPAIVCTCIATSPNSVCLCTNSRPAPICRGSLQFSTARASPAADHAVCASW